VWGCNSKPVHECTGHLNGRQFGAFIRCRFKRIRCICRINVNTEKKLPFYGIMTSVDMRIYLSIIFLYLVSFNLIYLLAI